MPRRASRNPLEYARWQQGTAPSTEPVQEQQEQEEDLAAGLFDPAAKRAVSIVARRYAVQPGTRQWGSFHDKKALQIRQALLNGKPLHEIDPTPTPTPKKREVMPWEWGREHLLRG